jgi:hypothetical protein
VYYRLTTIARRHKGERQRMYSYALIDPKDEPSVVFKYAITDECTLLTRFQDDYWQLLRYIPAQFKYLQSLEDSTEDLPLPPNITFHETELSNSSPVSPISASSSEQPTPSPNARLSLSATTQLTPTTSSHEPSSPIKHDPPTTYTHKRTNSPQITITDTSIAGSRERILRTPSPKLKGGSERFNVSPGTPPSERKAATGGLLKGVVASALRRKERR